jgi:hypothetical protein
LRFPGILRKVQRVVFGDPTRLHVTPPKPCDLRQGLAVVLIAKNEERHIEDWLKFHALAGARTAIIYDNGSTDQTVERAKRVSALEVIVVPWVTDIRLGRIALKRQPLAYAHAICTFGAGFRWMAFIDIDEYIVPVETDTIEEALLGLGDVKNISLPWTMFGPDGHEMPPKEPAIFAYESRATRRLPKITNFKCIVDPCDVVRVSTHKFLTKSMGARSVNDRGESAKNHKTRRTETFATADRLQLNHYYTFSRQELSEKIRGEAVSHQEPSRRAKGVQGLATLIEKNTIRDTLARKFLARHGITTTEEFRAV